MKKEEKLCCIKVTTNNEYQVLKIKNCYEEILNAIGNGCSTLENVHIPDSGGFVLIVDGDGLNRQLPVNEFGSILYGSNLHGNYIVGDIILASIDGPDLVSLPARVLVYLKFCFGMQGYKEIK